MPTEVIGLYGATTGGIEDALAQIDIPQDGVITGVDWDMHADLDADSEAIQIELSFIATNLLDKNDVRGRISSISAEISITTSGAPVVGIAKFVGPMDLAVSGGERLYLHSVSAAGVIGTVRCNIHLDVSGRGIARRSARR